MSFPSPINDLMGMVLFLKEHNPRKAVWLRSASGKIYQVSIHYYEDKQWELISKTVFKCDYCPPKYSFKSGNCVYIFHKDTRELQFSEKVVHYLESHPDKVPQEWLSKISTFFIEAKL